MNWKLKAIVQNTFSLLPFGEKLNYFSQINITKNLSLKELQIEDKLLLARKHIDSFRKYGQQPIEKAMHYQNRLRHKDYLAIINDAGFDILSEKILMSELLIADIEKIKSIKLDEKFSKYSLPELVIRGSHIVLRKKNTSNH